MHEWHIDMMGSAPVPIDPMLTVLKVRSSQEPSNLRETVDKPEGHLTCAYVQGLDAFSASHGIASIEGTCCIHWA